MNAEQLEIGLRKGLEIWSLQSLADVAILLCFVVLALVTGRGYLESARQRLSLRMATEIWDLAADYAADALLLFIFLVGLFVTNLDIMADIKLGLPFIPLAFILMGAALVVRAFHGGREPGRRGWWVALALIGVACLSAWFGFTFVMEAAGDEYFAGGIMTGPWAAVMHLRSDMNHPLAESTFLWAAPATMLVAAWSVVAALRSTLRRTGPASGRAVAAPRAAEAAAEP